MQYQYQAAKMPIQNLPSFKPEDEEKQTELTRAARARARGEPRREPEKG